MIYVRLITTVIVIFFSIPFIFAQNKGAKDPFIASTPKEKSKKKLKQINVLKVDGFYNHDWKETTREIKYMLTETGRFKIDISTSPSTVEDTDWKSWNPPFNNYDVVIQNANNYNNKNLRWPERIEK